MVQVDLTSRYDFCFEGLLTDAVAHNGFLMCYSHLGVRLRSEPDIKLRLVERLPYTAIVSGLVSRL